MLPYRSLIIQFIIIVSINQRLILLSIILIKNDRIKSSNLQARKEYERQLSLSYTAQQQGMLLRDNPTTLLPTSQPASALYTTFPQQTVT